MEVSWFYTTPNAYTHDSILEKQEKSINNIKKRDGFHPFFGDF
jgi:hypothetical protein